jgi:quercetin dioxygenase-like cupin family protein
MTTTPITPNSEKPAAQALPGRAIPYVVRAGGGSCHLVAGQIIRTLAGTAETNGGYGVVVCDALRDPRPIPIHWHEREHDTWFCTRGKLQVWCDNESRVLAPGDFAYVRPRDTHSYQSVAPRTQFFGVVAPGGWEDFFASAGEVWSMTALPPIGHPFDFSRMGPAMGKFRIMRVEDATYAPATPMGEADQELPASNKSYFLESGFGQRRILFGHLSTAVLTSSQSAGLFDMRVIEAGRGATMPMLSHGLTHVFLYMLDGNVTVTINGEAHHLSGGDGANLPVGTKYATEVTSGTARWLSTTAGGNAADLWDLGGLTTSEFCFPMDPDHVADQERLEGLKNVDVAFN